MDKAHAIKKVVIVGGGTAGWLSAALIRKVLGHQIEIELVESAEIGIVGVGEATIPPIQLVNSVLGLDEAEFLRETHATIKLAIRFENWRVQGGSYYHTFGAPGRNQAFCSFQHYWLRSQQLGSKRSLWDYDLNYLCCEEKRFAKFKTDDPFLDLPYAYHFDSALYGRYLGKISEGWGVKHTEGLIDNVTFDPDTGFITDLLLKGGAKVAGDLFVDCSGIRGLLIRQALKVDFEDWGHWLPCDRALAIPSERFAETAPYTRSIAHKAGWQWRIPLTHRNGNGHVYSSSYMSDDEAAAILLNNLDSRAQADEPRLIRFRTGRTEQQWSKNVVAVGLSSGFLEPLESTSIYLIQSAVVRLLKLFPHQGINEALIAEYNKESKEEYEIIRDFIILHYHVNEREDSDFWRDRRNMSIPTRLTEKIETFRANGIIFEEKLDIFKEASWLQVMLGQGIVPKDYHPLAARPTDEQLMSVLDKMARDKAAPVSKLLKHDEFLRRFAGVSA